jgi:hypothetical protein
LSLSIKRGSHIPSSALIEKNRETPVINKKSLFNNIEKVLDG